MRRERCKTSKQRQRLHHRHSGFSFLTPSGLFMPPPIWRAMPARPRRTEVRATSGQFILHMKSSALISTNSFLPPLTKKIRVTTPRKQFLPTAKKIVFTSMRCRISTCIYTMNADGSGTKRPTSDKGYDETNFSSWDGKTIVYRGYHPKDQGRAEGIQNPCSRRT